MNYFNANQDQIMGSTREQDKIIANDKIIMEM